MRNLRTAVPALLPLALFAAVVLTLISINGPRASHTSARPSEVFYTPSSRDPEIWYNGVALPNLDDLTTWEHATSEHPGIVQIYVPLGEKFPLGELQTIERNGAMPIVQIDYKQQFSTILAGRYNKIMQEWGEDIRKMKEPVALSFGHEMNGTWFPWGCGHVKPDVFISVWHRMHTLMGSPKALWVYTVNRTNAGFTCQPMEYYPGDAYVNWIGIDGYLRQPQDSFTSVFSPTIKKIRLQSSKPILLTEVGVQDSTSQPTQIRTLYTQAYQSGSIIGIVYFDQETARGNYRPQDNPAALAVFRKEISEYGNVHSLR